MSYTPQQSTSTYVGPAPRPLTSVALTLGVFAVVFGALVALTYPVAALATAALVLTTASAVRYIRRSRVRRATARRVRIPVLGISVLV